MTQLGIKPRSPGPLTNTLPIRPMSQFQKRKIIIISSKQKLIIHRTISVGDMLIDKMVNHIRECSKLAQKECKTREVGEVIHWELYNRLKFDHSDKWYMHKLESDLENEICKTLWEFLIQIDHPVPAKRPNLVLIKKKKRACWLVDFTIPADHKVKI